MVQQTGSGQELLASRSLRRPRLQTLRYHVLQVLTEVVRKRVVLAGDDLVVEAFHVGSPEGRLLGAHLVKHAPETPDVALVVVRHVLPDFGTSVVRSPGLRSQKPALGNFGHIQVSKLDNTIGRQEDIRALNVSVANLQVVECLQAADHLNEKVPYFMLTESRICCLVLLNFLKKVAAGGILHHEAEAARFVLKKGVFVAYHIDVVDRGENTDFVQSVFFLFRGQFAHFDLFHGVDLFVRVASDPIYFTE